MWTNIAVLIAFCLHTGYALYCLSCDDIFQPRHCKAISQCSQDEVCFVEGFWAPNGQKRYNVGCRHSSICSEIGTTSKRSTSFWCATCCRTQLCNAAGCGEQGYPAAPRGPICLSCNIESNPANCGKIEFCREDEFCFIAKAVEFGDNVYTFGCREENQCPANGVGGVVGKRQSDVMLPGETQNNLMLPGKRQNDIIVCSTTACSMCCTKDLCNDGLRNIRLSGGQYYDEGRLEVYHDGKWGTVCDDKANTSTAEVACRELGFPRSVTASVKKDARYGPGTGIIWMDDVTCTGTEQALRQCSVTWNAKMCTHLEDLGVVCRETTLPFRLANTTVNYPNQGRLEVKVNGTWGTVCDDNFSNKSAAVACHMFGFKREYAMAKPEAFFGTGARYQRVLLDEVKCNGTENSVMECIHMPVGITDCDLTESVGIICNPF